MMQNENWVAQSDVCRCCLTTTGTWNLMYTYISQSGEEEVFCDMLRNCFGVTLSNLTDENLSRFICNECVTNLRHADSFKRQVWLAEEKFASYWMKRDNKVDLLLVKTESTLVTECSIDNHYNVAHKIEEHFNNDVKVKIEPADEYISTKVCNPSDINIESIQESVSVPSGVKRNAKLCSKSTPSIVKRKKLKQTLEKRRDSKISDSDTPTAQLCSENETGSEEIMDREGMMVKDEKSVLIHKEVDIKVKTEPESDHIPERDYSPDSLNLELLQELKSAPPVIKKRKLKRATGKRKIKTKDSNLDKSTDQLCSENETRNSSEEIIDREGMLVMDENEIATHKGPHLIKPLSEKKRFQLTCKAVLGCTSAFPFRYHKSWFQCFYCAEDYMEINQLRHHTSETHNIDDELKTMNRPPRSLQIDITDLQCLQCDVSLTDITTMITHFNKVHNKIIYKEFINDYKINRSPYTCHFCSEQFQIFRSLASHMNAHYSNYICDVCGKLFLNPRRLKDHTRTHESTSVPCSVCGRLLKAPKPQNSIPESLDGNKEIKCQMCVDKIKYNLD